MFAALRLFASLRDTLHTVPLPKEPLVVGVLPTSWLDGMHRLGRFFASRDQQNNRAFAVAGGDLVESLHGR